MDPFEESVRSILESRKKIAERIIASRVREEIDTNQEVEDSSVQDRIPYSISKTIQYLKTNEYERNKKALKKQKEII